MANKQVSRTIDRLRKEPACGTATWQERNLCATFFVNKDPTCVSFGKLQPQILCTKGNSLRKSEAVWHAPIVFSVAPRSLVRNEITKGSLLAERAFCYVLCSPFEHSSIKITLGNVVPWLKIEDRVIVAKPIIDPRLIDLNKCFYDIRIRRNILNQSGIYLPNGPNIRNGIFGLSDIVVAIRL